MSEARRPSSPWLALTVLALGLFMTLLDLTIVNVAIPSIVDDLHSSLDQILWVLNGYSLVYAVLLITSGRLGDIFGPRNMFAAGIVVFTLASAFSGLAQDPVQLILARGAQGLGAAMLAPQGLPIMLSLFPPERRGGVFAIYGSLAGLAVLLGPVLGGFIVTHFGWRWIFYVNLPVGLLTFALAFLFVPDLRPGRRHRLDFVGVGLATAGLLGVVFGLIEGQRYDWGTVWAGITIPEIIAAGVVTLAVFLLVQWRRQDREPLLPFAVFKDRNFTLMALVLLTMGFAILGVFLPMTLYYQSVLGLSAFDAGLAIAPQPLAMILLSGVAAALAARYAKYILMAGLTLFAIGVAYIAWTAQVTSNRWSFIPGLVIAGAGMAGIWTPVFSLATRDLQPRLAGVASGVVNTIQELGGVIGTAAIGALLQNQLATDLHTRAVSYSAQLPSQARGPFVDGFSQAAKAGLQVGRGQTGTSVSLPPGIPTQIAQQIQHVAHLVFTQAFVDAMRPTMALAIAVILVAAIGTMAARNRGRITQAQHVAEGAEAAASVAS
ncbi:MAG TPA: DHA2 family efflux MFS transporter permease subunit [Candidatus Angelobacter sp.]|jgi:EmrB/QacA subfamily drug resistance transporter|nr:DHA2 family efflux MFS transporter permease subunit [Candidatus Angelobacter sp.]